jgi:phosphohistidine phosphatase
MCDHVAGIDGRLDLVLCSPARRTVDTLTGIRSALADGVHVETIEDLYGADVERLLRLVRSFADQRENAMIIGHNPGLGDLAALLAGSGDADARAQLHAKFPTGAIATLSFEGTWARLAPDAMQLDDLFTPRRPRP